MEKKCSPLQQQIIFIMGVSGSGKTTIGQLLSAKTALPFFDGDDFHPPANKEKMKAGQPLNDLDREGWLLSLNKKAREEAGKRGAVFACSALKERYRRILSQGIEGVVRWIFLAGDFGTIENRMLAREDHYMPASLLQSQFDTLEPPENALKISIKKKPEEIIQAIIQQMKEKTQVGLIGLGVMGKSLARNLSEKGFSLSLYNRYVKNKEEKVADKFIRQFNLENTTGFEEVTAFVSSLEAPRKILLMINAGPAVDEMIAGLKDRLSKGDIIIDGGNSFYKDTERRIKELFDAGIRFIGAGISGGEEGALRGPSIMPGGDEEAYNEVKIFLQSIAAKDRNGKSCCSYMGSGGAGHFVKMVHNGIEYAEMQLLAEVYCILRKGLDNVPDEIASILETWKKEDLGGYLLDITIDILRKKEGEEWLLDKILDVAGSKGTGSWAIQAAAELGMPVPMISEALFARYLSALKEERTKASEVFSTDSRLAIVSTGELMKAYRLARIINHHQGFALLKAASDAYGWGLNLPETARVWTAGCIIRSELMELLVSVLSSSDNILFHGTIAEIINDDRDYLTSLVCEAVNRNIAIPALSSALNYLNGYASAESGINVVQAQRDYFGAHTYQRIDDPTGKPHHTDWKPE